MLACLGCIMSTVGCESRGGRASEGVGAVVHALVSVSSRRLLEYKWDVLIHLNQGHMFRPTVKCSELNEALCCICHSPQEIKLGTHSAIHRKHSVTFKQFVVTDLIIHILMFDIFLGTACRLCNIHPYLILIRLPSNPAINSSQQQAFLSCAEERAPECITSGSTLIQDCVSAVDAGLPSNKPNFPFQLLGRIQNTVLVSGLSRVCSLTFGALPGKTDMLSHVTVLCD